MASLVLFGRMLLALAVVLGLVYGLSRIARRAQRRERVFGGGGGARIEVVARKSLSRSNSLIIVRAEGRRLLLAITGQSISLISELNSNDEPVTSSPATLPTEASDSLFTPRSNKRIETGSPWTVSAGDLRPPTAWDALVSTLRERSVRR